LALNWIPLTIYIFEVVLLYFLKGIRGVGERYSKGIVGWAGGIIALLWLFISGAFGFTPQSGKVIAIAVMATILGIIIIFYMVHKPRSRETFKFVVDIGIIFGLIMPALAAFLT